MAIDIVSDNILKEVSILDLLELLDIREIPTNKNIVINGFLSKYAPIYEPDTYFTKSYKISDIIENGLTKRDIVVESLSPPVTRLDTKNGLNIAYLYMKGADNPFILSNSEDGKNLKVEDKNKYIPIILEQKDLIDLAEKEVRIECSINVIDYKEISELLKFRNEEFRDIYSLFYDMYNDNVYCITLTLENVEKVKDIEFNKLEMVYAVEYNFTLKKIEEIILEKYLISSVNKIINSDCGWEINIQELDGREIKSFLGKDEISININKSKVGFYCKLDIKNRNNIRMKKRELKKLIDKFKSLIKKELDYEITFISDENDKERLF